MATQTYCDWAVVAARVQGSLHTEEGEPVQYNFNLIVAKATQDAAAELKRVFILKGYTPTQISSSDDIRNWNERLAAYFALAELAGLGAYNLENINESLDCRKEFREASALVIGNQAVGPDTGNSEVGGASYGQVGAAQQVAWNYGRGNGYPRGCY